MKTMMKIKTWLMGVLLLPLPLAAQTTSSKVDTKAPDRHRYKVNVLTRAMGDSVLVRWAPDEFIPWKYLNGYGYEVVRVCREQDFRVDTLATNIHPIRRREFMKKSPRILDYKADLIKRIEYHLEGELATVHIPWDDIREYSDEYNPNVLILEEMRLVDGVKVAIAIKTYPDGKLTGKIRCDKNAAIADKVAGYFGGGGHPYAAGFRTYDTTYEETVKELISIIPTLIKEANAS